MKDLEQMKNDALRIVGKGRSKGKNTTVELPPETLNSTDILAVIKQEELEVLLDLLYGGLEADLPTSKKKLILNLIKHLES